MFTSTIYIYKYIIFVYKYALTLTQTLTLTLNPNLSVKNLDILFTSPRDVLSPKKRVVNRRFLAVQDVFLLVNHTFFSAATTRFLPFYPKQR